MTTLNYTSKLKYTVLTSLIGLCISHGAFALETLSDEVLASTVGEGIALVPQDSYMVFQGENSTGAGADLLDRTKDVGFIHLIPVGPLTTAARDTNKDGTVNNSDHSVGKADLFMYGLALSKSDSNHSTRFASTAENAKIKSWGTASNPWILKVNTENKVPNFDTTKTCAANDTTCEVPYLTLEAPLYNSAMPADAVNGLDAYKLKLATWMDAFVLDQSKIEGATDLYHLGAKSGQSDANRANRLRLQAIWNDFSINGSRMQVFQTLGGSTNTNGMSAFYNNTLGLTALIRLNSGIGDGLRATNAGSKLLRLTTRETTNTSLLQTPALNGTAAPTFDPNEGLFLYNPNINLVLGTLYQPLVVSSDGRNFTLELARIPNKAEIYQKIYTDYSNPNSTVYLGSTCNVHQCGKNGITGYQGNDATHSSITIGSTIYTSQNNTLSAYKGADSIGVSFGPRTPITPSPNQNAPTTGFNNLGSAVIDGMLIQHLSITTKGL